MCRCIKSAFMEEKDGKTLSEDAILEENRRIWFATEGKKIVNNIEKQLLFGKDMKLGSKTLKMKKKYG